MTRSIPARRLRFATALAACAAALGALHGRVAAAEQPIDHGVAPLQEFYDDGQVAYDEAPVPPDEAPPVDESLFDEPSVDEPPADETPLDETPLGQQYADELMFDRQPLPMAAGEEAFSASAFGDGNTATVLPVSWISGPYFKAGVNAPVGDDLLEGRHEAGYSVGGGYRQPLAAALGGDRVFFDLGLSYLSAFGQTTRSTTGRQVSSGGVVTIVPILSTLTEVRRTSLNVALGWYWGEPMDNRGWDPQIRLATRLGGRVGSVRGRFLEFPPPPAGGSLTATHGDTDVFGGVFVGAEAILLDRNYSFGHVQWTLDGELANDWIEFEGFERGSLGTASLTLGFMLSR